jgi:hypothetical protein
MELIILIIIFLILVLFVRKDKDKVIDSFSLSDFLDKDPEHKNFHSSMMPMDELVKENKSIVEQINNFFYTNIGDSNGDDDGGE